MLPALGGGVEEGEGEAERDGGVGAGLGRTVAAEETGGVGRGDGEEERGICFREEEEATGPGPEVWGA